ncbi:MAG: HAMP domain-containing histidine kinase [Leptospiraceae bacterium]|nr:HAMP domain-containing histidine kinase [Leptospiraceae bacterium]
MYSQELTSVNLKEAIQSSLIIFEHRLAEKKVTVHLDIPEDLNALVDASSFVYSVFNNLLTNAMKFSYSGSNIYIKDAGKKTPSYFLSKDEGMGMPQEYFK